MELENFQKYIAPFGLLIAGLVMKFFKNKEIFRGVDKYWFYFVLMGVFLIIFKFIKE